MRLKSNLSVYKHNKLVCLNLDLEEVFGRKALYFYIHVICDNTASKSAT